MKNFVPSILTTLAIISLTVTPSLFAQDAPKSDAPWYDAIVMNVLAEASWSGNLNQPASHRNQLRIFDVNDNSFGMDAFELSVRKAASKPGEAGFHADLMAGTALPKVIRASGFNIGDLDFRQLYLTYVVPVGHGIRVDMGKFASPHGYESIDTWDGFNDNATRSFLFGYAVPFTHTGLRLRYKASEQWLLTAMFTNGWDNAIDSNDAKTVHAQVTWTPASALSFVISGAHGAEQTHNNANMRSLFDAYATWNITDDLLLGTCIDIGGEDNVVAGGGAATWKGIAGYGRYAISSTFALCPRAEVFDDINGARTGTPQTLRSFTLTPEYRPTPHFVLRGDLRVDQSTAAVFDKQGTMTTSQMTVSVNTVVVW